MPYGRYRSRRPGFRRTRGRSAYRPTAYRRTKVSWWRSRRARYNRKRLSGNFLKRQYTLQKIVYADTFDFDCSASPGYQQHTLRLNSVYDPQYSAGGGTPSGLVPLNTIFGKYKVCAAKVTVRAFNTGTLPIMVGMVAAADTLTPPNTSRLWHQALLEQGYPHAVLQPASYGSGTTYTLKKFYRIKNILGSDRYRNDNATAAINNNPANAAFLYLVTLDDAGQTIPGATHSVRYTLQIKFYTKFFNNIVAPTD